MLQRRGRRYPYRPINRSRPVRATFTGAQPQELRVNVVGVAEAARQMADLSAALGVFVERAKGAPWMTA